MNTANSTRIQQIATATIALLLINVNFATLSLNDCQCFRLSCPHSLSDGSVCFSLAIDRFGGRKKIIFRNLIVSVTGYSVLFYYSRFLFACDDAAIATNYERLRFSSNLSMWVLSATAIFFCISLLKWFGSRGSCVGICGDDAITIHGTRQFTVLWITFLVLFYCYLSMVVVADDAAIFRWENGKEREKESNINVSYVAVDIIRALYEMHC